MSKKIFIIGAGPGGCAAALKAAALGAEVVLAEHKEIGGVCLNRGCIPSKSYLDAGYRMHSLGILESLLDSNGLADSALKSVSWRKIQERRSAVIAKIGDSLKRLLESKKIRILRGTAAFVSAHEAEIKTQAEVLKEKFDCAIIAAGANPFFPPPFAASAGHVLDSDGVFDMERLPSSFAVVGAGAVGCELSCFFHSLGCSVDIVEMMPAVLPGEDEAVARVIESSFQKRGIRLHLGRKAVDFKAEGAEKIITLDDGKTIRAQAVIAAAGRKVFLEQMRLDKAGIEWTGKGISTDSGLRTKIGHIFAVGDVNGMCLLAHAASAQGETAAANAMGGNEIYDNAFIPKCVYSWPEAASIGLNRRQAEQAGLAVKTSRAFFASSGSALTHEETEGFVQVVASEQDGVILGAQIAGGRAAEMIHVFSVAIKARMKKEDLAKVVFAHPTLSETIREALLRG